jgi:RNA polymerase sigma-70 factor (ECF subfamily)
LDYKTIDDAALIRLIAAANPEALGELYNRYKRLVFSLAIRISGDQGSAEEVTQDVFLRVWNNAKAYRSEQAKVSTWLTSIARNRAIDELRKTDVRPEGHSIGWEHLDLESANIDERRETEEFAESRIKSRKLRRAITSLPDEQKEALAWAYFYGYSQSQIAQELDQPLGTVKTRLRLAMMKLREILGQDEFEP